MTWTFQSVLIFKISFFYYLSLSLSYITNIVYFFPFNYFSICTSLIYHLIWHRNVFPLLYGSILNICNIWRIYLGRLYFFNWIQNHFSTHNLLNFVHSKVCTLTVLLLLWVFTVPGISTLTHIVVIYYFLTVIVYDYVAAKIVCFYWICVFCFFCHPFFFVTLHFHCQWYWYK